MGGEEIQVLVVVCDEIRIFGGWVVIFGFGRKVMIFGVKMCFWKVYDV